MPRADGVIRRDAEIKVMRETNSFKGKVSSSSASRTTPAKSLTAVSADRPLRFNDIKEGDLMKPSHREVSADLAR